METLSRLVFTFLLNAVWQVSLVTVLTALAARLLRNAAARYRHALWVMGLGLAILLPLTTLPETWRLACQPGAAGKTLTRDGVIPVHPTEQAGGLQAAQNAFDKAPEGKSPGNVSRLLRRNPLRRYTRQIALPPLITYAVLSIYVLLLTGQLIRLAWAGVSASRLRGGVQVHQLPPESVGLVTRCQAALGLRTVAVNSSSDVVGPATVGFLRPVIVLPETLLQSAPSEELTSALCHEMAHVRRRDYLVNLVCEFALLPLVFHPAAWVLKRRIEATRELACDEAAAGLLLSAPVYARSLVNLAQSIAPRASALSPRYTLGVFDANILEERVMRLLHNRPQVSPRRARMLLGGATIALALAAMAAGLFSLTAVGTLNAASTPGPQVDFSGRWELDKTQSDLPSPSPENLVEFIDQRGSEFGWSWQFKVTSTSSDWGPDKPITVSLFALMVPEFSTTTDNKETVQRFGPGQVRSKTHWEGNNLVTDWTLERNSESQGRQQLMIAVTGRWVRSLSSDGNTQTIQITAHDPVRNLDGVAKAVFVRHDEDPQAFLGTWRAEFQGKQFLTLVLRGEGQRVSGTLSSFNINFDQNGNLSEAEPGEGSGSNIVSARVYNRALHVNVKESDSGEIIQLELKLLENAKGELTLVDVPLTPGSAVPKPLILTRDPANNQGANGRREEGRRAFLGTWRGLFEGKTYIIVNLKETDGLLTGGVSVGGFGIDETGQVVRVKQEAEPRDAVPISDAKTEGDVLSFRGSTPDRGTVVQFQMRLKGQNAAELLCRVLDARAGTPAPGWWKLLRYSDDHRTVLRGTGPEGGVVGGITGGVARGAIEGIVAGGVVGGITSEIVGGVAEGVVGGVPGGVADGVAGGI